MFKLQGGGYVKKKSTRKNAAKFSEGQPERSLPAAIRFRVSWPKHGLSRLISADFGKGMAGLLGCPRKLVNG